MRENSIPALTLKDICVSFNGVSVLKDASFFLTKNEIHGIVGKNGAGKSSFMKVVTGVYTPDSGDVFIDGIQLKKSDKKSFLRQSISMVYQDLSLVSSLNVSQNVFLHPHSYKKWGILQDSKTERKTQEMLHTIGVDSILPKTLVENLSAGEAQFVEIVKAMARDPKIIIFDEPTASLSNVETKKLFRVIKKLQEQGISIIYITHYLDDIMNICDRVTTLRNGRVIATQQVSKTSISQIVGNMLGDQTLDQTTPTRFLSAQSTETPFLELVNARTDRVGPITFYAQKGEIIGLAGLLGSGRTEILRMLYGLDRLESGSIIIDGVLAQIHHPKDAKKHNIALVPEERRTQGLVLDFSIEDNISMPILAQLRGSVLLSKTKTQAVTNESILRLNIQTQGPKQLVRFLSGGNQQKVVIGKCLASKPKVLLLDDPTFGVDVHAKMQIMNIMQEYALEGNIVIFVSSEFSEIVRCCTRTYIVEKQRIIREMDNQSMTEKELLKSVQ